MGNSEVLFSIHSQPKHHDCICLSLAFLPRSFPHSLSCYLFPNVLPLLSLTPWRVNKQILTQWVSNTSAALREYNSGIGQNKEKPVHPSPFAIHQRLKHGHLSVLALFCMSHTPVPGTLVLPGTFPSLQQRSEGPDTPPLLRVTS